MTLATNPTEDLFRAHGQFNGLSPLDESVANAREQACVLADARIEIALLEQKLALKEKSIARLRDALSESEAENDALRERLAHPREAVS